MFDDEGRIGTFVTEVHPPHQFGITPVNALTLDFGKAGAGQTIERSFDREDYALYHPAGSLGRRLMKISEVMRSGDELPLVSGDATVSEVLISMTQTPGRPGAALVVEEDALLVGIFTDGDLRRLLQEGKREILDGPVKDVMGRDPKSVDPDQLVEEAKHLMQESKVDQVPVVDASGKAVGLLDVQDLLEIRI